MNSMLLTHPAISERLGRPGPGKVGETADETLPDLTFANLMAVC